ncbi:TetR/AcrR family transcriptional regulator [Arthrobacter russicus]|uniref:AcrR family transcriptional regulator n=1 Tax=Arthrobacter russicus TaxID=172040 RepID=A0ABU1JC36_9MICC|nr:TetR family transcriptional regulator [Arthrobacter russicus]MDR6269974.1 AcrR family transcriptional regulator [Arthrobacter russicus]
MNAREAIITAARELFGAEGYTAVTIKDVASHAGYSPAMVMKVMGSKAELYAAATPTAPAGDGAAFTAEPLGFQLARRLVDRRERQESEPWAMALVRVHDAPDKAAAREEIREKYLGWLQEQLGAGPDGRAETLMAMLIGFGSGMRSLGLFAQEPADDLVQRYGSLLQQVIDG